MAQYEIELFLETKQINKKDGSGTFPVHQVKLKDVDGVVEIAGGDKPPEAGQKLDGEIENTQYGKRFKRAGSGRGGGGRMSPEQQAAITRQHSQEMALRHCAIKGAVPDLDSEGEAKYLTKLIDWFDDDVRHGTRRALAIAKNASENKPQQDAAASNDPGPAATPPATDDDIPF